MSHIYMYAHGGSGNHGCEAIVRSTASILANQVCGRITLLSANPEEDRKYGLDQVCELAGDQGHFSKTSPAFLKAYMALKLKHDYIPMDKMPYRASFRRMQPGDIALSIGGDNYCYADVSKYAMLQDLALERGAKTVLWGCSVEPEVIKRPEIAADLKRYSLIAARETISYEALKAVNPNTILVSDPAFCLKAKEIKLPDGFVPGRTVGLNLSPMAMKLESSDGIAMENYRNLISYLIEHTDEQVALIPHVVWADGDDRIPLGQLYEEFRDTGRVILVEDHSCEEQKYLISQCSFFIGARTHATIAAYSTGIPTLVLGYSVKSRGIARDLFGTEDGYVVAVQSLSAPMQLTETYCQLADHTPAIHDRLMKALPQYITRNAAASAIANLL